MAVRRVEWAMACRSANIRGEP
jgi:hypothetical protein